MRTKEKTYIINNFEIYIPDLEETKRYMKQSCNSHIASGVYHDKADFLDNLTEMLQAGFGIQLGFSDKDIKEV